MSEEMLSEITVEQKTLLSIFLDREVTVDFYLPTNVPEPSQLSFLLINDGQDLPKMKFDAMLSGLLVSGSISPVLCAGVHAGEKRMMEYGTAGILDYKGRGANAAVYQQFVLEELIPFVQAEYAIQLFRSYAVAGFSLGGLSALDTLWNHPEVFKLAGVFSGSLWWRSKDLSEGYVEETDRIMHQKIKKGQAQPGLRFYFTTGSLDETADRNGNGIIDSIDDTLGLIKELNALGYEPGKDISYINDEEGRHDVITWGKAMPQFLLWGWGVK